MVHLPALLPVSTLLGVVAKHRLVKLFRKNPLFSAD
jgi:hypothetical protein